MTLLAATAVNLLLFWGLLLGGLALTVGGSWQSILRYRSWRRAGQHPGTETVRADQTIRLGLDGTVKFPGGSDIQQISCVVMGATRTVITLRIDGWEPNFPTSAIGAGRVLDLSLQTPQGLLQFTTTIQTSNHERGLSPTIYAVLPFWLSRVQRRGAYRQTLSMPVTIERDESDGKKKPGFCRSGLVDNLSASGCCVALEGTGSPEQATATLEMLEPGTIILVKLPIPAISHELTARVVKSERASVRGGTGVRLRCNFFDMKPYEQELLVSAVFAAQRQSLQAGNS